MIVFKKNLKIVFGAMGVGLLDCSIVGLLDYWISRLF
jgi:hypothetical protein